MLSYRHAFHAGNFADVLKHAVLVKTLEHLVRKDKAFEYIDTHAGAGVYDLASSEAVKTGEHAAGFARLSRDAFPQLDAYFDAVAAVNEPSGHARYPGSPLIARHFLRSGDRAWLFELHPQDVDTLRRHAGHSRRTRVHQRDGLKGLLGLVPPASRRALVLVDPSYELRNEFNLVFDAVSAAVTKFPTGIYVVWYPVVERNRTERFVRRFRTSGIQNIQRFELGTAPDSEARGMTSSGVIVINPPWTLLETMSELLPSLAVALADDRGSFRCDTVVPETG